MSLMRKRPLQQCRLWHCEIGVQPYCIMAHQDSALQREANNLAAVVLVDGIKDDEEITKVAQKCLVAKQVNVPCGVPTLPSDVLHNPPWLQLAFDFHLMDDETERGFIFFSALEENVQLTRQNSEWKVYPVPRPKAQDMTKARWNLKDPQKVTGSFALVRYTTDAVEEGFYWLTYKSAEAGKGPTPIPRQEEGKIEGSRTPQQKLPPGKRANKADKSPFLSAQQSNSSTPQHQEALKGIWKLAFPEEALHSMVPEQWKEMGLQGKDPSADFRGAGSKSLENLLKFAQRLLIYFRDRLLADHSEWEDPFAVSVINTTSMLIKMLDPEAVDKSAADLLYRICVKLMKHQKISMRALELECDKSFQDPVAVACIKMLVQFQMLYREAAWLGRGLSCVSAQGDGDAGVLTRVQLNISGSIVLEDIC